MKKNKHTSARRHNVLRLMSMHALIVVSITCVVIGVWMLTDMWLFFDDSRRMTGDKAADMRLRSTVTASIGSIDAQTQRIETTKGKIAYYMRTHNVVDQGFDHVAHYDQMIRHRSDSLALLRASLTRFLDGDASLLDLLRIPLPRFIPAFSASLPDPLPAVFGKSARMMEGYTGETDSLGRAHGKGTIETADGYYYEGEWMYGKRHGFGMGIGLDGKVNVGEWKNDKYMGERMIYTDERIYGIDISRYQHEKGRKRFKIDWQHLAITSLGTKSKKNIAGTVNYPISFIYIKSTEGISVRNRYFKADYTNAHKYRYKVGAYHFFSTKSRGVLQARFFCKNTIYRRGDLPPVLDIEPSAAQIRKMGGTQAMFRNVREWIKYVETMWGVKPVLYVSQTFVNKYLPSAPDLMKNYDVWIARYGEYKPDVNLLYWQLCPDGRVRGIQTEVDINVFNGFRADFEAQL